MMTRSRQILILFTVAVHFDFASAGIMQTDEGAKTAEAPETPTETARREAEPAVRAALDWLVRHQSPDGSWKAKDFTDRCETTCENKDAARYGPGRGLAEHDIGVTGLAMLALTAHARHHGDALAKICLERLHRAARFLIGAQVASEKPVHHGRFGSDDTEQWIYGHALATLALGEYYPLAENRLVARASLRAAAELCLFARNDGFGWRYGVKPGDNDTSVTGWMVLALKAAESARLGIPPEELERAFKGALRWLDRATASNCRTGYLIPGGPGARLAKGHPEPYPYSKALSCMTSVGVLSRLVMGQERASDFVRGGVRILLREPPRWHEQKGRALSKINFYYWYHGTRALWHCGGKDWIAWSQALRSALLPAQRREGDEAGSWDPIGEWGIAGGRVYATALATLTLQVLVQPETPGSPEGGDTRTEDRDLATLDLLRDPVNGWTRLVPEGARWKYWPETGRPSPGFEWTSLAFNDTSWPEGASGFGARELGKSGTFFLRHAFDVPDPASLEKVVLVVRARGDFAAFLNGLELVKSWESPPAGTEVLFFGDRNPPEAENSVEALLDSPVDITIHPFLVQPGSNLLALYGSIRPLEDVAFPFLPSLIVKRRDRPTGVASRPQAADDERKRREAYLQGRQYEFREEHKLAAEKLGEVARLGGRSVDPYRRLVRASRASGDLAEAEASLREGLRREARSVDEIWDLWYTLSTVDLKRSVQEIHDAFPSGEGKIESALGADLRWLIRRLAEKGTVRIDCGAEGDRFFSPRSRVGSLKVETEVGKNKGDIDFVTVRRPMKNARGPLYRIPLPLGVYRVVIHTPGELVGDVTVEGKRVLAGFATRRVAELRRKIIEGPVRDGTLDIALHGDTALLSGLEISLLEGEAPEAFTVQPPFGPPLRPEKTKSTVKETVELESSPFHHPVSSVTHKSTRWQVRASFGSYESSPVLDLESEKGLTSLSLPTGGLLPDTQYFWRVAYIGSNDEVSSFSEERSFRTGDCGWDIFRFDLRPFFNKDVIANSGDEDKDDLGIDGLDRKGAKLIERGFDGETPFNLEAQGLPFNRVVGLHLLADYNEPNVLQLACGDDDDDVKDDGVKPVRLTIPAGAYSEVRLLVAGGDGDSRMLATLEYEDGSTEERTIPCDDWFHDNPEDPVGTLSPGVEPLIDGMDRMLRNSEFDDVNDAALFEVILPLDPDRVLEAIVFHPEKVRVADNANKPGLFNLFAATGLRVPKRAKPGR